MTDLLKEGFLLSDLQPELKEHYLAAYDGIGLLKDIQGLTVASYRVLGERLKELLKYLRNGHNEGYEEQIIAEYNRVMIYRSAILQYLKDSRNPIQDGAADD